MVAQTLCFLVPRVFVWIACLVMAADKLALSALLLVLVALPRKSGAAGDAFLRPEVEPGTGPSKFATTITPDPTYEPLMCVWGLCS